MNFYQISALLLILSLLMLIFSKSEKELSVLISVVVFIVCMTYAISRTIELSGMLKSVIENINSVGINAILKIFGIITLSSIAIFVCNSAGQTVFSYIIEILSTIESLIISFPIIKELFLKILKMVG